MFLVGALVALIFVGYGKSQPTGDVGIIGGHNIPIEKAPYMALLRQNGTKPICGSSIIHERFILTAAHCIDKDTRYKVQVGTNELYKGGRLYDVKDIFIHENYINVKGGYDICILKLNDTLTFGRQVNKIALDNNIVKYHNGIMLQTAGWGSKKVNGTMSQTLQQVEIPIVPLLQCQYVIARKLQLTFKMICAGTYGKDTCVGDSGGPLTYKNHQVGITSFGIGCGNYPGVYTRVSTMLPWITQTISDNL